MIALLRRKTLDKLRPVIFVEEELHRAGELSVSFRSLPFRSVLHSAA